MATVLERMAALVSCVGRDDLPDDVLREAGRRLLDAIGCMAGGARGAPVQAVFRAVGSHEGPATLVCHHRRGSMADAALANCTALRYLDYMDGHPGPYTCHPSLVIPAALAAAEARRASGLDLARGIVLGYEIDIRLQLASGDPDITAHGWSGSTNLGIAAPVAIGGLLGLSETQLAHAMAISTIHAPALDASSRGQMAASKACVDGMVVSSSVTASLLAEQGMTGGLAAYEGDDGFVKGVARRFDDAILLAPIDRFRIVDAYTKRYNAVKCAQSAVGSVLRLRDQLPADDPVESVTLRLAERDWRNQSQDEAARRRPVNRDTANHSVVYCLAAALVEGELQAPQFEPRCLSDPRILDIIDKTAIGPDPALTAHWPAANPASVEIRTRSGRVLHDTTIHFPGHPRNAITDDDLESKFRSMAEPRWGSERTTAIAKLARELASLPDVSTLAALIGGAASAG